MSGFRILSLQIMNARTIEMMDITPTADVVKLQAENGNGKTTVLDIIESVFTRQCLDDRIVRRGEDSAIGSINLGEYVIKRVIRKDKTPTIEVRSTATGKKADISAEEFVAKITGKNGDRPIALDISRIVGMDGPKRTALLLACAGIDAVKLAEVNTKHKDAMDTRKDEKKALDRAEAAMKEFEKYAMPVSEPPSTADLVKQQKEVADKLEAIAKIAESKTKEDDKIVAEDAEIKRLEGLIAEARARRDIADKKSAELGKQIVNSDEVPLRKQLEKIAADTGTADAKRENYNNHKKYAEKKAEWQKQYQVLAKAEKDLEAIVEQKKTLMESGKYPTPNLSVQDGEIYFKGTHWSQLSESERLKVALAIANGLNPQLRVLLIRDGNAFDDNAMAQIAAWAKTNDFQIWIERVNSIPSLGTDTVYIVEGKAISEEEKKEIIKAKTGV